MNENLTSTKFILTITVMVLSFVLVVLRMIEALEWFKWAVGLVGVYATGNVVSKIVDRNSAE